MKAWLIGFAMCLCVAAVLTDCAAELDDTIGVTEQELSQTTSVNCVNNGNLVSMTPATPRGLLLACGNAMRYQTGVYGCTGDNNTGRCDLAFGSGGTPLVIGACASASGNIPLRNPPGGTINRDSTCQGPDGTISKGFTPSGPGLPVPTMYVAYGASCGQCADQVSILRPSDHRVWYAY
jgi:hypothetical protein